MSSLKILYIENESAEFTSLAFALKKFASSNDELIPETEDGVVKYKIANNTLICVKNSVKAIKLIENEIFDIAFIDFKLSEEDGDEVGKKIFEKHFKIYKKIIYQIMLTAYQNRLIDTLRAGVFRDFLTKPLNDLAAFAGVFVRFEAFKKQEQEISILKDENTQLKNELKHKTKLLDKFDIVAGVSVSADSRFESLNRNIIGESNEIKRVKYFIQKYADTEDNVLIIGKTGTGKDLIAEAIHKLSKRNNKIFKTVNCAAIPEELIESTLFGVIPKYPGFHNDKSLIGIFEEAHEGTVFLDEIDRMSLRGQSKLLRLIEDQKVIKLGETDKEGRKVDVRIIAAIKPLALDKIGITFLEDLYGRLQSLFPVIPPLSERKEDIPLLVNHFIDLIGYNYSLIIKGSDNGKLKETQYPFAKYLEEKKGNKIFIFNEEGMSLIKNFEWCRNVRELRKFIENIFSIFVNNKNSFTNQVIPVDDIRTAFIFHNAGKNITDDDQKMLNEKYSNQITYNTNQKINLKESKYKNALDVMKMLNNACSKVIESAENESIALDRIREVKGNIKENKINQIINSINEGVFDTLAIIGLFCKSKNGKEGMAFEGVYDYLTPEFFNLYNSQEPEIINRLGDLTPLRTKLGETLSKQEAKLIKKKEVQ
jgi:two-component system, NtrC family, nitrogen regulation response regulator NtrX